MQTNRSSRPSRWSALALVPVAALVFGGLAIGGGAAGAQLDGDVGTAAIRDTFINRNRIAIRDNGQARPYPSTITITGLPQRLYDVNVKLRGLTHPNPDDLDIMVEAPNGAKAVIMSDAGGSGDVSDIDVMFDDETGTTVPDGGPLQTATYRPENYDGREEFNGTANVLLGTFDRINPNGVWKLFVRDDDPGDRGEIANGWALEIYYGEAPKAVDDRYRTERNQKLEVSAAEGVLANDNDGDPEPGVDSDLTARLKSEPRKGTVTLRANGSFTYRPDDGARNEDSFTYTLRDQDGLKDVGRVTIIIE